MTRRVILDCDGVLLNYTKGLCHFAFRNFGLVLGPDGPCSYDLQKWTGLDRKGVRGLIESFNGGTDTGFEALPPMPGAIEGVRRLREAGCHLYVLSSANAGGASSRSRHRALDACFGDVFEDVILIAIGAPKKDILARFDPCDLVEDHLPNAIAGMEVGHRSHMIRQPHNRAQESASPAGLLWARDLLEVNDRINPSHAPEI